MRNQLFRNTGRRRFEETSAGGGPGVRARRYRPRRRVRRHRQRRRRRRRRHEQRRTGAAAAEPAPTSGEPLAGGAACGRPAANRFAFGALGRGRARRAADALAARADRRQLSLGQRHARPLRARLLFVRGRDRRPMAGWWSRTMAARRCGSARNTAARQRNGALTTYESGASRRSSPVTKTLTGGGEEGRMGRNFSCHSSGGELFAPRVARLSEHEGRGDEHALIASVFVSVPLVLTLAPASGGRTNSTVAPIDGRKNFRNFSDRVRAARAARSAAEERTGRRSRARYHRQRARDLPPVRSFQRPPSAGARAAHHGFEDHEAPPLLLPPLLLPSPPPFLPFSCLALSGFTSYPRRIEFRPPRNRRTSMQRREHRLQFLRPPPAVRTAPS